jgi:predicted ABC-type ATPase
VLKGGHNVPEETIRRRYDRGITNFFRLYRPLAASWRVYDNADSSGLSLIASGGAAVAETVVNQDMWDKIKQSAK